jgi:hypothetical protein
MREAVPVGGLFPACALSTAAVVASKALVPARVVHAAMSGGIVGDRARRSMRRKPQRARCPEYFDDSFLSRGPDDHSSPQPFPEAKDHRNRWPAQLLRGQEQAFKTGHCENQIRPPQDPPPPGWPVMRWSGLACAQLIGQIPDPPAGFLARVARGGMGRGRTG